MRLRLRANRPDITPQALLEQLKRIQYHEVRLATDKCLCGPTMLKPEQLGWFGAIEVDGPTQKRQRQAV